MAVTEKEKETVSVDDSVKKPSKRRYYVAALIAMVIAVVVGGYYHLQTFQADVLDGEVPEEVARFFEQYDFNDDGYLSLKEFQHAYFLLNKKPVDSRGIQDIELESFHDDVKAELNETVFEENEKILNLKASMQQIDFNSMRKYQDPGDESSFFHLHGLKMWSQPNIVLANFSVSNFSLFLPPTNLEKYPGKTWDLIPKALAGDQYQAPHLSQKRFLPPKPETEFEKLMLYILSMLHNRPFLHMRFPPRGAAACTRAVNDEYYDIMFRLHPEFQLNEPPYFPFWYTPALFIGNIIIKKDGTHIQYFNMHLPTRKQLNIDMEWITSPTKADGTHGQEVDIGFMKEMQITSTQPSDISSNIMMKNTNVDNEEIIKQIKWKDEISKEDAYLILEREFYPFKTVPYYPFNETFEEAKKENKLIHHILLWGSLDDQSC